MKDSSYFFLFVLFGTILSSVFLPFAYAVEANSYFEENTVCAVTTTSAIVLNVTDGTDFDFQDGSDYLIVASSSWGGDDNAHTYQIALQHNSTIFEGSQEIVEPKSSSAVCGSGNDSYRYMFWTVWSPSTALEASQNILLNYTSLEGTDFLHDDATIFVMELDELTEGTDWLFDETFTDEILSSNFGDAPEATFLGSAIDGEFTEQPALFFSDEGNENDDGYVDCIRVFDVALNSTTASLVTNSTDTCFAFPDTSIPTPVRIFDLNGNATDLKGGSDIVLSDGGTGLNGTGWNFLEADDAQIIASEIPDTEYAIEMVLSFEGFTTDTGTFVFPRILDWHNNEEAFNGQGDGFGLHGDELGQTADAGIWFWDVQEFGVGYGGEPMTNNTLSHILIQRNSTGFVEGYKDGELAFAFDDNGDSWFTESSAKLSFTPADNNNDWVIFGADLLGVEDLANQYETRLNHNNETFTPYTSREGEDIAEQWLNSFARVFTLSNTEEHTFVMESRNDEAPVGTNERLYSSIFALNLERFTFHTFNYTEAVLAVPKNPSLFNTATVSVDLNSTATNDWFIMGGFDKEGSQKLEIRMQVENNTTTLTDEPADQTTQEYDFSDGWDNDDRIPNYYATFENLNNNTHTVNIDASKDGNGDTDIFDRSLFAFTTEFSFIENVFNGTGENPMSMTDNVILSYFLNGTGENPMSMIDNATITTTDLETPTDPMSMVDDTNFLFNLNGTGDNTMSMVDDIILSIFLDTSPNNPMSMIANATTMTMYHATPTDPMSMVDDTILAIIDVLDGENIMSMIDSVNLTYMINNVDENPMSMIDDSTFIYNLNGTGDNPMSMVADTVFNRMLNGTGSNIMSMVDDIILSIFLDTSPENPMSMVDSPIVTTTDLETPTDPMSMIDDTIFSIIDVLDGENPMSMIDDIILSIFLNNTNNNPMSMVDDSTFNYILNGTDDNPMSMIDNTTFGIFLNNTGNNFMSMIDDINLTYFENGTGLNPMSMLDNSTWKYFLDTSPNNPNSMVDDINLFIVDILEPNFMSMTNFVQVKINFVVQPPIVIPPVVSGGGGSGSGGGQPVSSQIDSDDDGFLDFEDDCPTEPETFNGFEDEDGCPDVDPFIETPEPITVADLGFPFGFNELSVVNDFINLETDSPQPQVEDLAVRWLGDEPITITSIDVGSSPFEFQFENLPLEFGNNQIGFTQGQIIYTLQEPAKECTNVFSFDCVDNVTYDIPVTISGEVRGKTVIAQGSIVVDNSDRFNPYWLVFLLMAVIIIIALIFWRRKRKSAPPSTRTLLKVTESKTGKLTETRTIRTTSRNDTQKGSTRKILDNQEKKRFFKTKSK